MHRYRIVLIAIIIFISAHSSAWANEPPESAFIPLKASYKTAQGGSTSLPHFFPLKSRPMGKFIRRSTAATPQAEDIPVPHEGKPEAMTAEQANQILSIFGGNE